MSPYKKIWVPQLGWHAARNGAGQIAGAAAAPEELKTRKDISLWP